MEYRNCFLEPPTELQSALDALLEAALTHAEQRFDDAATALIRADCETTRKWANTVNGPYNAEVHGPGPLVPKYTVPKSERDPLRMPTSMMKAELISRDGWHCRLCEVKLLDRDTVDRVISVYPDQTRWHLPEKEKHSLLRSLQVQYDHIIPHSRGGRTDPSNLILTCAPCNYGRSWWSFEDCRLIDPRSRLPKRSDWNGMVGEFV